jgi:hypothetical protein
MERDKRMPAATAAVVGQTDPTFLERNIPRKIDEALRRDYPGQYQKFFRPFLERKKTESGHSRG